jgi:hypothetical protein
MKNQTIRLCLVLVFISELSACKKNEQAPQTMETAAPTAIVGSFVPTKVTNSAGQYFKSIDTICPPYLAFTNVIDSTKFSEYRDYPTISDGNITLETSGLKYPWNFYGHHPFAWWNDWNTRPYVENQHPSVWVAYGNAPTTIKLSKKCYVFGFELSAQVGEFGIGPFTYIVKYGDTERPADDKVIGYISNVVVAPNGARLFAVKSDIPFDTIEIIYSGSATLEPASWGITNIRYVTDKDVYDKHKND